MGSAEQAIVAVALACGEVLASLHSSIVLAEGLVQLQPVPRPSCEIRGADELHRGLVSIDYDIVAYAGHLEVLWMSAVWYPLFANAIVLAPFFFWLEKLQVLR